MSKNNTLKLLGKVALSSVVTIGTAFLARTFINKKYGAFIAFKNLCLAIRNRLNEE